MSYNYAISLPSSYQCTDGNSFAVSAAIDLSQTTVIVQTMTIFVDVDIEITELIPDKVIKFDNVW